MCTNFDGGSFRRSRLHKETDTGPSRTSHGRPVTISNFLTNVRALPSWGEKIDRAVMVYIDRIARGVRGCDAWAYETNRYYGNDGLKVQECRKITLLPPDSGYVTREDLELEIMVA